MYVRERRVAWHRSVSVPSFCKGAGTHARLTAWAEDEDLRGTSSWWWCAVLDIIVSARGFKEQIGCLLWSFYLNLQCLAAKAETNRRICLGMLYAHIWPWLGTFLPLHCICYAIVNNYFWPVHSGMLEVVEPWASKSIPFCASIHILLLSYENDGLYQDYSIFVHTPCECNFCCSKIMLRPHWPNTAPTFYLIWLCKQGWRTNTCSQLQRTSGHQNDEDHDMMKELF